MSHIYHPRTGDGDEPIFFDNCPECVHHADDPVAWLDSERLVAMWNEMVRVEASSFDGERYKSNADGKAGRKLREVALAMQRLPEGVRPFQPIEGESRKLSST